MAGSAAISVDRVSKRFELPGERHASLRELIGHPLRALRSSTSSQLALDDVSLEIEPGEFLGVVGRNGSGKSTLLKILAGIYVPSSGDIAIRGSLVPFIELGVGFNPELSGRENVYLNAALFGFSERETRAMYDEIVEFAELGRFMDQKLGNYSSGMQVRLAFSVAIRAEADILLLDEVLAVGDADFRRKCFAYFREAKKLQRTIVFVSHDMSAIREYCTRAVLIDGGRIVAEGAPDQVAKQYSQLNSKVRSGTSVPRVGDGIRSGNGDLEFEHPRHPARLDDTDEFLTVEVRAAVARDVDDPNFGISIKNAADVFICGTSTRLLGVRFGNLEAGDTVKFTWEIPNVFHDGVHFVNLAAVDISESEQYDWWDEASSFDVVREIETPYIVAPTITLRRPGT